MLYFLLAVILLPIAVVMVVAYWYIFAGIGVLAIASAIMLALLLAVWLLPGAGVFFLVLGVALAILWLINRLADRFPDLNKRIF